MRLRDVSTAFFHCDPDSQFKDYGDVTARGQHKLEAPRRPAEPAAQPCNPADALVWRACREHCCKLMVGSRSLFSCALQAPMRLELLSERLGSIRRMGGPGDPGGPHVAPGPDAPGALGGLGGLGPTVAHTQDVLFVGVGAQAAELLVCQPQQGQAGQAPGQVFFSAVGRPSQHKHMPPETGHGVSSTDLAVTVHAIESMDAESNTFYAHAEPCTFVQEGNLCNTLCLWSLDCAMRAACRRMAC